MGDKKGRGFAGMDAAKQREIASKGGKAAHQKGTAHRFTAEEARIAGRKGGQAAHIKGTAHEFTPEEARVAGRKGGQAARGRSKPQEESAENGRPNGQFSNQGNQAGTFANQSNGFDNAAVTAAMPAHRPESFEQRGPDGTEVRSAEGTPQGTQSST